MKSPTLKNCQKRNCPHAAALCSSSSSLIQPMWSSRPAYRRWPWEKYIYIYIWVDIIRMAIWTFLSLLLSFILIFTHLMAIAYFKDNNWKFHTICFWSFKVHCCFLCWRVPPGAAHHRRPKRRSLSSSATAEVSTCVPRCPGVPRWGRDDSSTLVTPGGGITQHSSQPLQWQRSAW